MAISINGNGITSANIADGAITNADINSSAAIDGTKISGSFGKVLQVIQTHLTARQSQSITAFGENNISGLSASITPSSTSSRIRISVRWAGESSTVNNYDIMFGIKRGTTPVGNAAQVGSRNWGITPTQMGYHDADPASTPDSVTYDYIDSPSSTSSITYIATINSKDAGTLYTCGTVSDTNSPSYERMTSTIIVEEIGA